MLPSIETDRLLLRPPIAEDFTAWAEMMANDEVAQFLGGVMPRPVVWRNMAAIIGAWTLRGYSMFSVIDKSSGAWLGRAGPWFPEGWPGTEIGWAFKREYWGNGYAFEAASAALDWSFEHLGWTEAIHCIASDNIRSLRLAERLGARFRRTEKLPPPLQDTEVMIYGQGPSEWQSRRYTALRA